MKRWMLLLGLVFLADQAIAQALTAKTCVDVFAQALSEVLPTKATWEHVNNLSKQQQNNPQDRLSCIIWDVFAQALNQADDLRGAGIDTSPDIYLVMASHCRLRILTCERSLTMLPSTCTTTFSA